MDFWTPAARKFRRDWIADDTVRFTLEIEHEDSMEEKNKEYMQQ